MNFKHLFVEAAITALEILPTLILKWLSMRLKNEPAKLAHAVSVNSKPRGLKASVFHFEYEMQTPAGVPTP